VSYSGLDSDSCSAQSYGEWFRSDSRRLVLLGSESSRWDSLRSGSSCWGLSNLGLSNVGLLSLAQLSPACSDSGVIEEWRYLAGRSGPLNHCHLKVLLHPAQLALLPMLHTTRQQTAK
jgi:hypothetical protein